MRALGASRTSLVPGGVLAGPWVRDPLWRRARAVPTLDLRFADNKSLTDAVTGASLVTFTRASSGTYVDSAGVIQTATNDVPRFDHNPTTGESLGLLVEEARTNSIFGSADFSSTYTSLTNLTATVDTAVAPDGSTTADTIAGASSTLNIKYFYKNFTTTATGAYTASIYLKANTQSIVLLRLNDNTGVNGVRQLINLSTGQLRPCGVYFRQYRPYLLTM